jgi:hypothetical protein
MTPEQDEPIGRNFADLTPDEQAEVGRLLFEAAAHRCREWDALGKIEAIVGHEIDLDVSEWAACLDEEALQTGGTFNHAGDLADSIDGGL